MANWTKKVCAEELIDAEEEFLVDVQIAMHALLQIRGLKQRDLAALIGVSEPYVSQLFSSDASNLTLRTLAKVFAALGDKVELSSDILRQKGLAGTQIQDGGNALADAADSGNAIMAILSDARRKASVFSNDNYWHQHEASAEVSKLGHVA